MDIQDYQNPAGSVRERVIYLSVDNSTGTELDPTQLREIAHDLLATADGYEALTNPAATRTVEEPAR